MQFSLLSTATVSVQLPVELAPSKCAAAGVCVNTRCFVHENKSLETWEPSDLTHTKLTFHDTDDAWYDNHDHYVKSTWQSHFSI